MGVPKLYSSWISKNVNDFVSRLPPQGINTLSIDMNGIIHRAAQQVYGYGNFEGNNEEKQFRFNQAMLTDEDKLERLHIKEVIYMLSVLQNIISPSDVLLISVDGTPPFAKIHQQRYRRFASTVIGNFDPNSISPGTSFMIKLDSAINKWIKENVENLPITTIYSPHDSPGEGEHKIIEYYRNGKYFIDKDIHVIYGNDTDFFMLTMLQSQPNIWLCRESYNRNSQVYYKEYIDINNLKLNIIRNTKYIENFVIISFLLGNDFLPTQPALKDMQYSVDLMIMCLQNIGNPKLVDSENRIVWRRFSRFLKELSKYEYSLLKQEFETEYRFPTTYHDLIGDFDFNKYRNEHYAFVFENVDMVEGSNYEDELERMSLIYLSGIQWTFDYYMNPIYKINKNYYYKYALSPLLNDCLNYIMLYEDDDISPLVSQVIDPNSKNPFLTPGLALLAIMPKRSQDLVRVPYTDMLVKSDEHPLYNLYPDNTLMFSDGVWSEWQQRYLLPDLNARIIYNSIDKRLLNSINELYPIKEDLILIKATNTKLLRIER